MMFNKLGYKLTIANHGIEACQIVESHAIPMEVAPEADSAGVACTNRHFHVVLMDVSMEQMDGLECTRQIRKHEQRCAEPCYHYIIGQTASINLRPQCEAAGMNAFITKPISLDQLVDALKAAYDFKLQWMSH